MARILLGVSGGIAAYKALESARLAVRAGHSVRVIQTPASERFVGRASFAAVTGAPVLSDEFEPDPARGSYPGQPLSERTPISHLALVEAADVYLIAPASANTIAKLAHGLADNLVTTAALAAACPVAVAPAMNNRMYLHAATQANLELLATRGITIVPPGDGELASYGEYGVGRLAEPACLLSTCERLLAPQTWRGVRVLVSAGGTREPIDAVRYIGNRSSGRMGIALAARAAQLGAEVTLVAANVRIDPGPGVRVQTVQTAAELAAALEREFPAADVLIMAAAVSDFRPAAPAHTKFDKRAGFPALELEPTQDILAALTGVREPHQILVGFAAEHGPGGVARGAEKLARKGLDAIVVNDVSQPGIGFDADENEVTILTREGGEVLVPRDTKEAVAVAVLDVITRLRAQAREESGGVARAPAGSAV